MNLMYREDHSYSSSLGLLLLRVVVGAAFVRHGLPKIQSPMNWMGDKATVPGIFQLLAAVSEFFGGMLLIAGALTSVATLLLAITMLVAMFMVHFSAGHPFVAKPGEPSYELAAAYLAAVIVLLLLGPGKFSVDAFLFGRKLPSAVD